MHESDRQLIGLRAVMLSPFRILLTLTLVCSLALAGELRGVISDDTGQAPLAARLYIQDDRGEWFFAESADAAGSAVRYSKARSERSVENHTTLSAYPFRADLPPGTYILTAERGKEYLPATQTISVGEEPDRRRQSDHAVRFAGRSQLLWRNLESRRRAHRVFLRLTVI